MTGLSVHRPLLTLFGLTLLLTAIPYVEMHMVLGTAFPAIPPTFTDESFYQARIQTIVKGHVLQGNPYFFEHQNDLPLVVFLGTWVNAIPQLLGLSVNAALLVNFIFWSLLFAATCYWLFRTLSVPPWISVVGTVLMYIQSYAHVWRPVNLQPVYPIYFLFFTALFLFLREQSRRHLLFLALTTGATFYLYAYLWQAVGFTFMLLLLYAAFRKNWSLLKASFVSGTLGAVIGLPVLLYAFWLSHTSPFFWESVSRLGLVNTHIPMAEIVYSGGWIGLTLLFLGFLFWKNKTLRQDGAYLQLVEFLAISGVGLWVMQGGNAVTGKLLETGEHVKLLILPWLLIATVSIAAALWERRSVLSRGLRVLTVSVLAGLSVLNLYLVYQYFSPFLPMHLDRGAWQLQELYAKPFAWLTAHETSPVVVWSDPHDYVSTMLPIFTNHFTLYAYFGMLELMPEQEIRERYLVSQYFRKPSLAALQSDEEMALYLGRHDFPHEAKTLERKVKLCRIFFFWNKEECGSVPTPRSLLGDAFFVDLEKTFANEIKPNIHAYLKKYHVSYILKDIVLDPQYDPKMLGATRVYADERYEIWKL